MAPSWLPQNIQKRIFRYILNRLAVFSNLDLTNLDVSVGAKTNLTLRDVELDTDKFNLPGGVYIRNGTVGTLNLSVGVVGVGGGVQVDGSDIELTIALSSAKLDEDDLSNLLSRTTADLAESLLDHTNSGGSGGSGRGGRGGPTPLAVGGFDDSGSPSPPSDDSDNISNSSSSTTGYGFGDLPNMVSRLADAALSQLNIVLYKLTLRLIIDEESTMDVVVSKVQLSTNQDGTRVLKVSDIEVKTPYRVPNNYNTAASTDNASSHDSDYDDDYDGNDGYGGASLMQSTLFSHEQASTMYMSAMSSLLDQATSTSSVRLLWCDSATICFKGILESDFRMDVNKVRMSLEHPLPEIIGTVLNFIQGFQENTRHARAEESHNSSNPVPDQNRSHSNISDQNKEDIIGNGDIPKKSLLDVTLQNVQLAISPLLADGVFENSQAIALTLTGIKFNMDNHQQQLISISVISLARGEESKIFRFRKYYKERWRPMDVSFNNEDNDHSQNNQDDLVCNIANGNNITLLVPHPANFNITVDDSVIVFNVIQSFLDSIKRGNNSPARPVPRRDNSVESNSSHTARISAKFNTIDGVYNSGSCSLKFTIFPITLDSNKLEIGRILISINNNNEIETEPDSITINTISLLLNDRRHLADVAYGLEVYTIKVNLSQNLLHLLISDIEKWNLAGRNGDSSVPHLSKPPRHLSIQEPEDINFKLVVRKAEVQFTFSSKLLGQFDIDLGGIAIDFLSFGMIRISISTLFVSRDFSDIDPDESHVALIHSANPSRKVSIRGIPRYGVFEEFKYGILF